MLLVFPVSVPDASLAADLTDWFISLGGFHKHPALIVFGQGIDDSLRRRIMENVGRCSLNTQVFEMPTEKSGWPFGPNNMFKTTWGYLAGNKELSKHPWYFFEPDNTPMAPGWLDALDVEYRACGKPFMGVKESTRLRNNQTGEMAAYGFHMVGTGIHPPAPEIRRYSCLVNYIHAVPWDVYWQAEIVPHMHDTALIQHNWSSCNYRRTPEGVIVCEQKDPNGIANPLRPEGVVVVHGCKDASLIRILRKDAKARR